MYLLGNDSFSNGTDTSTSISIQLPISLLAPHVCTSTSWTKKFAFLVKVVLIYTCGAGTGIGSCTLVLVHTSTCTSICTKKSAFLVKKSKFTAEIRNFLHFFINLADKDSSYSMKELFGALFVHFLAMSTSFVTVFLCTQIVTIFRLLMVWYSRPYFVVFFYVFPGIASGWLVHYAVSCRFYQKVRDPLAIFLTST